ncbi:MAG: HesA/MoeB/ThiF family protein [Peptostreptococcaceae bacterium]
MVKERYKRNISTLTVEENEKLKNFKVCVIGCGGLGGYIIEMIGRIGVGYITAIDGDVFEESNLNRQILSDEQSFGTNKAQKSKIRMMKVNSDVFINSVEENINSENCERLLKYHDLIIDALDNINTRLIVQETCKKLNIPMIHGAIDGWYGQVTTIMPGDDTLNIIYKSKRDIGSKLGNPSFTPATIASIQVSEAIKILFNKGEILRKKLLAIDLFYNDFDLINLD